MTPEPILVDCVGSGARGHWLGNSVMCPMCGGQFRPTDNVMTVPDHQRDDVLAMIDRGDFG